MKNTNCTQLINTRSSFIINATHDLSTDFVFANNNNIIIFIVYLFFKIIKTN